MAGTLAWFDLLSPGGVMLRYSTAAVVARAAQESQNREVAYVLELDMDSCANVFGQAPCTATGVPCYNTFNTCKDRPNFIKTVKTYKFGSRGLSVPGELVRPYITSVSTAPTEIKPGTGLSIRSKTQINLTDETDNDAEMDPYVGSRAILFRRDWDDNLTTGQTTISGSQSASGSLGHLLNSSGAVSAYSSFAGMPVSVSEGTLAVWLKAPSLTSAAGLCIRASFDATVMQSGYRIDWLTIASTVFLRVLECTTGSFLQVGSALGLGTINTSYYNTTGNPATMSVMFSGATIQVSLSAPGQTTQTLTVSDGTYEAGECRLFAFANPAATQDFDLFTLSVVAQPFSGTFWRRFQARNLYSVGRFARLRRGYVVDPFSWLDFDEQLFIIDAIKGPDEQGRVGVVLTDILKLADRSVLPSATSGKLTQDMQDVMFADMVASATSTSISFPGGANPSDDAYTGAEVYIYSGTGNGQRREMLAYDGDTRTATVDAWLVIPDSTSMFEVSPLSVNVGSGRGGQYGDDGYVRINDEVIRFAERSGDVLSWPSSTYRGQFGTAREDHNANAGVQLCKAWFDAPANDVIVEILAAAGITTTYIDTAGLVVEALSWMIDANITACITQPETVSNLLKELSADLNLMIWWDPVWQMVRFKVNVPQLESTVSSISDDDMMQVRIERLDSERITEAAQYYGLRTATSNPKENKNFLNAEVRIDTDAESPNEYNDVRQDVAQSRWLSAGNEQHTSALVARRVTYLRDAPHRISFRADPRTRVDLADLVDVATRSLTDTEGYADIKRCRITKIDDQLAFKQLEAVTTTFAGRRWLYIAPTGAPNFSSATEAQKQYGYIANSSAEMSDGTDAYRVI